MRARTLLFASALVLGASSAAAAESAAASAPPAEAAVDLTAPTPEAPPPAPYAKSLVVDASVGALGFLGKFGKLAPPGPWFHAQVGWEVLRWLMLYGEGELSFTDTSNTDHAPNTRVFPLYGFGGGARLTARLGERFAIYGQPGLGALKADVAYNTLGLHGFHDAESLGVWLGVRAGIEWYQVDRHFAIGLSTGFRLAQGFAKTGASSDTPLALDGGASVRYAF